jgi:hypothetical protein
MNQQAWAGVRVKGSPALLPGDGTGKTRSWAEVLYERNPEAQGLYWTSTQDNCAQALMLFGTRTDSARYLPLIGLPKRLRTDDGTIDLDVLRLAKKIDVDLVRWASWPIFENRSGIGTEKERTRNTAVLVA